MNGDKVYTVIHTVIEADGFRNPLIETKAFDTEDKAKAYLKKDFDKTFSDLGNGGTVLDIISATNYGGNAEIELGKRDEERLFNEDNSTIEVVHKWRIYIDTINYEG